MTLRYEPPNGWSFPRLEQLAAPFKGSIRIGPFGSALKKDEYSDEGIRVLGIEDVFPNKLISEKRKYIPERKFLELTQYSVSTGDILVTNMGTVGRTCVVPEGIEKSIISSHLIKVTLDQSLAFPSYISWILNYCPLVVSQIKAKCHGAIMAGFNSGLLKELHIPLPPLPEQRRIAAILDQADAINANRRKALAHLDSLTQSIFIEMFGDPITNPKGWPIATLKEFFQFRTGKLDSNAAVIDGDYPFFTCAKEDYRIDSYAFDCEALLLAGNNANADYSVKHYKGKFNAYQRTYVITLNNPTNSYRYSAFFLENHLAVLKRVSKGSSTKYLTLGLLNNICIPVPPPALQDKFGEKIEALHQVRSSHLESQNELDKLFVSLQHRAFRGEL